MDVVSGAADKKDVSDAAAERESPRESPPDPVSAHSLDPSPTNDDVDEPADERQPEERPAWPAPIRVRDTSLVTELGPENVCEISFWRGYFKAAFYARLVSESDPLAAVARSPYFPYRGTEVPERSGETLAAYEALRQQLERAGWEHTRPGNPWFADVFRRRAYPSRV
jgi:hypothetical protein